MTVVASFWTWHGWNALVAVGTLTLAAVTFGLVVITWLSVRDAHRLIDLTAREVAAVERQTQALGDQVAAVRDQAAATERQVAISAASLEAGSRPVLVGVAPSWNTTGLREDVPYSAGNVPSIEVERPHYEERGDFVYCSVPLRNVGGGVAFIRRASLIQNDVTLADGRVSQPVVPPGTLTRTRFVVRVRDAQGTPLQASAITAAGRGFAEFTVYLVYSAASSDLVTASQVTVRAAQGQDPLVSRNEIYNGDGRERALLTASEDVG